MWFVYFLELANGDIYVGSTNDLTRRVASHQKRQVSATKTYCPVALKAYVAVATEAQAPEGGALFQIWLGKGLCEKALPC